MIAKGCAGMERNCQFCGKPLDKEGRCLFCGREAEEKVAEEAEESEFSRALHWEIPEEPESPQKAEAPVEEGPTAKKMGWKKWQKAVAAVLVLAFLAGMTWFLWPRPQPVLPAVTFTKDGSIWMFRPGEEQNMQEVGESKYLKNLSVEEDGSLLWGENTLWYLGLEAEEARQVEERQGQIWDRDLSPDGKRLVYLFYPGEAAEGELDISQAELWCFSIETGEKHKLAQGETTYRFSAEGSALAFTSPDGLYFLPEDSWEAEKAGEPGDIRLQAVDEDSVLYLVVKDLKKTQMQWKRGGQPEVLMENVDRERIMPDGTGYLLAYSKEITLWDTIRDDYAQADSTGNPLDSYDLRSVEGLRWILDGGEESFTTQKNEGAISISMEAGGSVEYVDPISVYYTGNQHVFAEEDGLFRMVSQGEDDNGSWTQSYQVQAGEDGRLCMVVKREIKGKPAQTNAMGPAPGVYHTDTPLPEAPCIGRNRVRESLKKATIHSPCSDLYWFDGETLQLVKKEADVRSMDFGPGTIPDKSIDGDLSDGQLIYGPGVTVRSLFSSCLSIMGDSQEAGEEISPEDWKLYLNTSLTAPKSGSPRYLLLQGQKYLLPESLWEVSMRSCGFSQNTLYYTLEGDGSGEEGLTLYASTLENGEMQEPVEVETQVKDFRIAPDGQILTRRTGGSYCDGNFLDRNTRIDRLLYSPDGGVYYFAGKAGNHLCRVVNGEGQSIAEDVYKVWPISQDYVAFTTKEVGEDKMDLMVYNGVGAPKIVAEDITTLPVPGE